MLFFSASFGIGQVSASQVLLINSSEQAFYSELANNLETELSASCGQDCTDSGLAFEQVVASDLAARQPQLQDYALIITLGVNAQQALMEFPQALSTSNVLHALVPENQSHHDSHSGHHALVLDQPVAVQLEQTRRILGNDVRLGVLYTGQSAWHADEYRDLAASQNIQLQTFEVNPERAGESLTDIMSAVDAIVMIPDKTLYNRLTINQILLTGFLNRVPFIAYSKSLAKTGALASIITPSDSIVADIARKSVQMIKAQPTAGITYPSAFKLIINQQIAESLGIELPAELLDDAEVIR